MKSLRQNIQGSINLAILAVVILAFALGALQSWQDLATDNLFITRAAAPEILIVSIDDESISEIGTWPFGRDRHAALVDRLAVNDPNTIAFDISFFESKPEDSKLAASLAKAKQQGVDVVLAAELTDEPKYLQPISALQTHSTSGIVNLVPEKSGIVRKAPLGFDIENSCLSSWAFEVYRQYSEQLNLDPCNYQSSNIYINYSGPRGHYKQIAYKDILAGKFRRSDVEGKIVLIGATAKNLHDESLTPVDNQPISGVEIHANIIDTLLRQDFIVAIPTLIGLALLLLLGLLSLAYSLKFSPVVSFVINFALTIVILVMAFVLFDAGVIVNFVEQFIVIWLVWISVLVQKYFKRKQEVDQIKQAFGQYVSKPVLNDILGNIQQLELGGKKEFMTVLFSDVRGFTSFSEKMDAEKLVKILSEYLEEVSEPILNNEGVIDKYIGDAVMAFWGAPLPDTDHALRACISATRMLKQLEAFNSKLPDEIPPFKVGVGINSGWMSVGNIGSKLRFDYTVIGDDVNLGSRLEGLTKMYGVEILLSESTLDAVNLPKQELAPGIIEVYTNQLSDESLFFRFLDFVKVKGKTKPINIYSLYSGELSSEQMTIFQAYYQAFTFYREGKWAEAIKLLKTLANTDGPAGNLLARIEQNSTPTDWDGSWQITEK